MDFSFPKHPQRLGFRPPVEEKAGVALHPNLPLAELLPHLGLLVGQVPLHVGQEHLQAPALLDFQHLDYEAAVRLLEQNEMIPEQLKYCPFCGSSDIKFVLKKEHRLRAVMSAIASLLAATPPGNNHWEYVCHACGGKFEKPVAEFHSAEI